MDATKRFCCHKKYIQAIKIIQAPIKKLKFVSSGMEFEDSKSKRNHFVKPSKPPIHPDVKFKKLPFYDVVSDVIKPSSLSKCS